MMTRVPFAPQGLLVGGRPEGGEGEAAGTPLPLLAPSRRCRPRVSVGRKHKMEGEPPGGPLPKKRLTEAAMEDSGGGGIDVVGSGGTVAIAAAPTAPLEGTPARPPGPPLEMEMEEVPGEAPCEDAARRRLREIEERIICDEDEEEEEGDGGRKEGEGALHAARARSGLPTLVLSDTLKTGLRRDYEGELTKKIIQSMSRPSMELVLWKPLPEFLSERAKPTPLKTYKPAGAAERGPPKPEILGAVFRSQAAELQPLSAQMSAQPPPPPPPPLMYVNADLAVGPPVGVEEEMEL